MSRTPANASGLTSDNALDAHEGGWKKKERKGKDENGEGKKKTFPHILGYASNSHSKLGGINDTLQVVTCRAGPR